ncbi:MAG: sulfatase-like hydrolase/transferase [Planctomycetota bacterium]|jgi:uncharacterized sulfatase
MNRRDFLKVLGGGTAILAVPGCDAELSVKKAHSIRPNILFCISDDQSWLHAGAYGDKVVNTPSFDRVAREGVLFTHAFSAAPSCTPSRSAILTGQEMWRLEEGGLLMSTLPRKFAVYPDLLEAAGYHVGYVHKGWSPGNYKVSGWDHNPVGSKKYSKRRIDPPTGGMGKTDYAGCFEDFLASGTAAKSRTAATNRARASAPARNLTMWRSLNHCPMSPKFAATSSITTSKSNGMTSILAE